MYRIFLSTLRMYTCAALNGFAASTNPVIDAKPCSEPDWRPCAVARTLPLDTTYPTRPATAIASISTYHPRIDRRWDDRNAFRVSILYSTMYSTRLMSEADSDQQSEISHQ